MMNRRGFLGAMLGAMAAPAVVKAENMMKIFVPLEKKIFTSEALTQAILRMKHVGADYDGDVHFSHMRDGLERNSVSGAHLPRGLNGRIYHIDEFPFHLDTKGGTDDFDYFKAFTQPEDSLASQERRRVEAQIRQVKLVAGPLELSQGNGVGSRSWNERLLVKG
jgi:hypothetical protein